MQDLDTKTQKKGTITINPFKLAYKAIVEFKIEIKLGYKINEVHDKSYEILSETNRSRKIGEDYFQEGLTFFNDLHNNYQRSEINYKLLEEFKEILYTTKILRKNLEEWSH